MRQVSALCCVATALLAAPTTAPDQLRSLSDTELLKRYESTALAAGATDAPLARPSPVDDDENCLLIKGEILRRGREIVPSLVTALKTEVTLTRPAQPGHFPPGLITEEIGLLIQMGEPEAVPPLLDILQMALAQPDDGGWNPRLQSLSAVEQLTFVCFHRAKPHWDNYSSAVEHPGALALDHFSRADLPKAIQLYRDWLAGEGKDPTQWLPIARKRARALLEGDKLDDVYCAAAFLTGIYCRGLQSIPRDDDPNRTMRRIAQILSVARHIPGQKLSEYEYHGQRLPITVYNWVDVLAAYGPRARPFASILIRLQRETTLNDWGGLQEMRKIGGDEIMAYYFEVLPTIDKEVQAILKALTTPKSFSSDDPRLRWLEALGECRSGIDRWAGQCFPSDGARLAWWNANKGKSPEQWLRDSLPITVQRADTAKDPALSDDAWLFHELLPDAPYAAREANYLTLQFHIMGTEQGSYRQKWFDQHRFDLVYDPDSGSFRLKERR